MVELVGILNVTPDSFSDGGLYDAPETALVHAAQLFADGASFIDVGAESTRPNATKLTAKEEQKRLELVLPPLLEQYPGRISLDTYHPETAEWALGLLDGLGDGKGQVIINDVTGMNNPDMISVVARYNARFIVSHLPGTDIQAAHSGDLIKGSDTVIMDLMRIEKKLAAAGVSKEKAIFDPGIGFGKTPELNRNLLEFASYFPGRAVMIGYSRKRFLGENRMDIEPNLAAGKIAVAAGARYLRVHDVAGHRALL
jgi:dihydropteroate synthase